MSETENTEDQTSEEGAVAADGGGKSKKLIMIIVPIILLLGGGAGLYFSGMLDKMLGKEPAAAAEGEHAAEGDKAAAEGEHGEGAAKEGEGGGHGESEHVAGAVFMKIPDLIVNLTSSGQPRYLRLSIQLELANEEDMKKVEAVMPRVIDQFQTYLRELRVEDLRGSKGIYRLQMELLARVNAAAAPVEVKDVLFQEILIQ